MAVRKKAQPVVTSHVLLPSTVYGRETKLTVPYKSGRKRTRQISRVKTTPTPPPSLASLLAAALSGGTGAGLAAAGRLRIRHVRGAVPAHQRGHGALCSPAARGAPRAWSALASSRPPSPAAPNRDARHRQGAQRRRGERSSASFLDLTSLETFQLSRRFYH